MSKVLAVCGVCILVLFLVSLLSLVVYSLTCEMGDYMIVEDSVTVKAENGREFKHVREIDPWFRFFYSDKVVIVPEGEESNG